MRVGRFVLYEPFAEGGGGASLHLGCTSGEGELRRAVAIKQLDRAAVAAGEEPLAELLDEARLAARVHHRNVVQVLELCQEPSGVFLVMEYVHGAALAELLEEARRLAEPVTPEVACAVVADVLLGLHAAHGTTGPGGEGAGIVHRDVSPQNILVGADGVARIGDFGIAKSAGRMQRTAVGQVKGKLVYLAPERLLGEEATPRSDVYSAGVVLFELLAGRAPFAPEDDDRDALIGAVLGGVETPPSRFAAVDAALDAVVLRATAIRPEERYPAARAFAAALEEVCARASARRVGEWVEHLAAEPLARRARRIAELLAEERTEVRAAPMAANSGGDAKVIAAARGAASAAPRADRAWMPLALLAALAAGGAAAWALHEPTPTDADTGTAVSEAPTAPPAAEVPGPTPPTAAGTATPTSSSSTAGSQSEAEPAARGPGAPPRAARPANDCVPPYRVDASGIRRWKKGCTE